MLPSTSGSRELDQDVLELLGALKRAFNSDLFSDVVFLVGKEREKILAHRLILSLRSAVFSCMLASDFKEARARVIEIPDSDPKVFFVFLKFLYTYVQELRYQNPVQSLLFIQLTFPTRVTLPDSSSKSFVSVKVPTRVTLPDSGSLCF